MPRGLLIVDDEEPILFALKLYFRGAGWTPETATTLEDALDWLGRERFDVVLTDLSLTPGNAEGLTVISTTRQRLPQARVVVLTAFGTAEREAEALRLGACAVLRKPVALPDLARVVDGR
jgi:two-component system, NtrC family, response regulator PilR